MNSRQRLGLTWWLTSMLGIFMLILLDVIQNTGLPIFFLSSFGVFMVAGIVLFMLD